MCRDERYQAIGYLNELGSHIHLKVVDDTDEHHWELLRSGRQCEIDTEPMFHHEFIDDDDDNQAKRGRDPHDDDEQWEGDAEELSYMACDFLENRAGKCADEFEILADYDEFVSFLNN